MNRRHHCYCRSSRIEAHALIVLFAIFSAGCRTSEPTSARFASVTIKGRTPEQICQTTAAVFQEHGYVTGSLSPASMMFQKEGSRGQSLAYGGVVDTHYGAVTMVRVKAAVVDLGNGTHRLQCNAFMVRNANDSFFEDESPLLNVRSGPYQALLDKIAERLK